MAEPDPTIAVARAPIMEASQPWVMATDPMEEPRIRLAVA